MNDEYKEGKDFEWIEIQGKQYRRFFTESEKQKRASPRKANKRAPTPSGKAIGYGDTSKKRNAISPLARQLAEWVSRYHWSHWCTFTTSMETSSHGARRQIERFFHRFNHQGLQCLYFVIERGDRYERIHLHAIAYFKEQSIADVCWHFWKSKIGRCSIRTFETEGGAVEYITNYVEKGTIDWDILGKPKEKI